MEESGDVVNGTGECVHRRFIGILRAANRSHVSHPRLAKMPSSAHCLETDCFCYGEQIR